MALRSSIIMSELAGDKCYGREGQQWKRDRQFGVGAAG